MLPASTTVANLTYTLSGTEGPWLALIHPLGSTLSIWSEITPLLARRFRVIAYDLRGHGASEIPQSPYTLSEMARDHIGLMDRLHISRTHICGLALGGEIAQIVAAQCPERVANLVLADTTFLAAPHRKRVWEERVALAKREGMAAVAKMMLPVWFSAGYAAEHARVVEKFRTGLESMSIEGFEGSANAVSSFDLSDLLPQIRCRTLVIVGEADHATPPATATALAVRIHGAEVRIIPGAGHFSVVEQPQIFAELVLQGLGTREEEAMHHGSKA